MKLSTLALGTCVLCGGVDVVGAFVQLPALSPFSSHGRSTSSAQDAIDEMDSEILSEIEKDLDQEAFLSKIEKDLSDMESKMQDLNSYANVETISGSTSDVYSRAVARMEALSQDSIKKHKEDMTEFEAALKTPLTPPGNGPLVAFSLFGLAIGAGMIATAPEAISGIDYLSTIGLPSIEFGNVDLGLSASRFSIADFKMDVHVPDVDLPSLSIPKINSNDLILEVQGKLDTAKEALITAKDSLLAQTSKLTLAVDGATSEFHEITTSVQDHLRTATDSLTAQVNSVSSGAMSQVDEIRYNTLSTLQEDFLTAADTTKNSVQVTMTDLQGISMPYARNLDYFARMYTADAMDTASAYAKELDYTSRQYIADVEAYGTSKVDVVRIATNKAQDSVSEYLPAAQASMLAYVEDMKGAVEDQVLNVDIATMMPALRIDELVEEAKTNADGVISQIGTAVDNASAIFQSKLSSFDAGEVSKAVPAIDFERFETQFNTAVSSIEMPEIDMSTITHSAKAIEDTISSKLSTIY